MWQKWTEICKLINIYSSFRQTVTKMLYTSSEHIVRKISYRKHHLVTAVIYDAMAKPGCHFVVHNYSFFVMCARRLFWNVRLIVWFRCSRFRINVSELLRFIPQLPFPGLPWFLFVSPESSQTQPLIDYYWQNLQYLASHPMPSLTFAT